MVRRVRRNLRPAGHDPYCGALPDRGHPLCGRALHHSRLLVHGLHILRQPGCDGRAGADRHLCRDRPRSRAALHSGAARRRARRHGVDELAAAPRSRSSRAFGRLMLVPSRRLVIVTLGLTQVFAWGSSYYLPAVLSKPIAADTDWPLPLVVGGLSLGLLAAGVLSPHVGALIGRHGGRPVLVGSSLLLAAGLVGVGRGAACPPLSRLWLG